MPGRRQHGEGSVYQRGKKGGRSGQWVAVADLGYRAGRRDRREFTGPTPAAAMDKRQRFLDRRRDGFTMPAGRQPYVSEWMLHWLYNIARRKVEPTTWTAYRQRTEGLICPYFERVLLPDLNEELVEEWHRYLEGIVSKATGRPLAPATIGQAHRVFSAALKVAVVRGRLPRNPCSNVSPPLARRTEPRPPTAAEARKILARCETWPNGARWVLAITTGLRQGEALALRWQDVQLAHPAMIQIRLSAARVGGERIVKTPKSAKPRWVPLPAAAVAALLRHKQGQSVASLEGLVFTRPSGRPWHPRADWQDWTELLADLGLPHYRVHDLRHATATFLLEAGEDIRVVQEIMGHASPDFTRRTYQHVTPEVRRAAADAMDRYLGG